MGKFKALIPPKEYKRLLKKVRDGETEQDNVPSDDESPFDPGVWFPEWFDGDYPMSGVAVIAALRWC